MLKIILRCQVVSATLFMVASANIIRKRDLFLDVDISAKTAFLVAGWASVPCRHSLIGLENKSVCVHRCSNILLAFSAQSAFCRLKMRKMQKAQMSEFGIMSMFLTLEICA